MYRVISKCLMAAAMLLAAYSCGDAEKDSATELYNQSEAAIEQRNYTGALELLDTLNARYPGQTAIRRQALVLRARAMEGIAIDSIEVVSAQLAAATIAVDSLTPEFAHQAPAAAGIDGYWLPKGVSRNVMGTTGIQARVTDDGYAMIVANVQGREIGLRAIELKDGSQSCRSETIAPALVVSVRGSESASFRSELIAAFGPWLAEHPGANKVVLVGSRGNASFALTPALRKELRQCFAFASATQAKRNASIRREKFERMLATARDQIANLATTESNE